MAGAIIEKVGDEEVGFGAQDMKNLSESEMVILTSTESLVTTSAAEATCLVYAREADSDDVQRIELTFALNRAPAGQTRVYRPVNPDAIPGMTVGDAVITESPLGYSVQIPETVTDTDQCYNIMKKEIVGVDFLAGGGTILHDDGIWYFEASQGQGTLGDTLTIRYYDWDKVLLGTIAFQLVDR